MPTTEHNGIFCNHSEILQVSAGNSPADLLLRNARIINTFTAQIEEADVAVHNGCIAGIGDYVLAEKVIDIKGRYLCPGLIDGHIHLESTHISPGEFAKCVVPRGVLAIVTDFHEIANVSGLAGIEYILKYADLLPMDIFGMAPSCVPSTSLETSGKQLNASDLIPLLNRKGIIGLGEVMNYPGVISGDPIVMEKIKLFKGRVIDGHAPGLKGKELNAYLAAGIMSDHECTTLEEAEEKLSRGMYIMIREGSSEKNLETLFPLISDQTYKRCFFVVDDRDCLDLLNQGGLDAVVRKAVKLGLNPIRAVQMATINPAEYFRLEGLGAISPGYRANMMVLDNLKDIEPLQVFYDGRLVAEEGSIIPFISDVPDSDLSNSVNIKPFAIEDLALKSTGHTSPVIEIIPDQIITKKNEITPPVKDGIISTDLEKDLLKLVVLERHRATGHIGIGLVKGFGLKNGALASSISHDSHNIISVGTNDLDIFIAIKELEKLNGGLAVAAGGFVQGSLALPIAGLISEQPLSEVAKNIENLKKLAYDLGCVPEAPFALLSFLALPVIPELRLTDLGMVDVDTFRILQ